MWRNLVNPNGTLDEKKLIRRELIYRGRNGKNVERCFTKDKEGITSFIFKPLTNEHQAGKEVWAHQFLLPRLRRIAFPQLLAHSGPYVPTGHTWFIFEDLGEAPAAWSKEQMVSAARCIPHWQRLPLKLVPASFKGEKPLLEAAIEEIEQDLYSGTSMLAHFMTLSGEAPSLLTDLQRIVIQKSTEQELVVSHGDLHVGNLALKNGHIAILDWEHVHINSIYWDLFGLLEMSHPYYTRQDDHEHIRESVLQGYWEEQEALGYKGDHRLFLRNYYRYASIYSAWMLLLVSQDLRAGLWSQEQLLRQQQELFETWSICMSNI